MKLRESGMPDEVYWESLFDIDTILNHLGIDGSLNDVVELGCGYGTFTIPVARRIGGAMTTIDIDPDMVNRTVRRGKEEGLSNIFVRHADIFSDGFCVPPESQDACLLFNILHCEDPVRLLGAAAQIVRPSGLVLIIHWRYDDATPRGPSMAIRPKPDDVIGWAAQTGVLFPACGILDLPPWHYGIRFALKTGLV